MVEHWNGRGWTLQPTPTLPHAKRGELLDVSCPTAQACIAVGDYRNGSGRQLALAEKWNGHRWNLLSTPTTPGAQNNSRLLSVSCATATACAAVGNAGQHALAERWNGKRWTLQATPAPPGSNKALNSVSCVSAARCTAVGSYTSPRSGGTVTLALSYA